MPKNNFKSTERHRAKLKQQEERDLGQGSGKGKVILFGEHFVVYGLPALAAGIAAETTAKVTRTSTKGWTVDDRRPETPGYKVEKAEEQKVSTENVIHHLGLDLSKQGIHIELGGDLVAASGIGASAANCVALARALNEEFRLGLNNDQINEAAYEGEKGYHGTPSGIDNTASTFGGLIWYVRDPAATAPVFEKLRLKKPVGLVIASTGLTASTKKVVDDVAAKKKADSKWFDSIASQYKTLVMEARESLLKLDLKKTGQLMNKNQELLRSLTVSCTELENLVERSMQSGALGAKLTGTGRGGLMIALVPDQRTMDRVADSLQKAGAAAVWKTTFGQ
jgi:mevalonate kinase